MLGECTGDSRSRNTSASMKKEQKRRPKPRDGTQLFCGVCGDKALGYNFDAITCESCKAFFRRNANKSKSFLCSFDGNCRLDPHSRKFCSGCRLEKCFAIGMKKDWILSNEQLSKRRSRLRLRSVTTSEQDSPSSSVENSNSNSNQQDALPASHSDTFLYSSNGIPEVKTEPDFYTPMRERVVELPGEIKESLATLQRLYDDVFEATYTVDQAKNLKENPTTTSELFNMADIFIRRLIRFAKSIPEFKDLMQEDQIHLLKGGIMEMFVLRSVMSFDLQKGAWKYSMQEDKGEVKGGALSSQSMRSTLGHKMYADHMHFVRSLHELVGSDRLVFVLLSVVDLLCPTRPKLKDIRLVTQGQEKYLFWLRSYLESVVPVSNALDTYHKLLFKLTEVQTLGEASAQVASTLDISRLEPLLLEVFDL